MKSLKVMTNENQVNMKINKLRRQVLVWTAPAVAAVTLPAHAQTSVASFTISKVRSGGPNPATAEGDVIEYTVEVDNTGTQNLTGVVVTDTMPDGAVVTLNSPSESLSSDGVLEVGETWTYTTSYTVTLEDLVDGNDLVNTVSAVSDQVSGAVTDDETVSVTQLFSCESPPLVTVPASPKCAGNPPIGNALVEIFAPSAMSMELIDIQVTSSDPQSILTIPSLPANLSNLVPLELTWDGPASDAINCLPLAEISITLEYACSDGVSVFETYDVTGLLIATLP